MRIFTLALALTSVAQLSAARAGDAIVISGDRLPEVPEEYYVEEGDTLWDICTHFFDEPWRWPTVWAMNPHVTNPHWIYPGDVLRLRLGKAGAALGLAPITYTVGAQGSAQVTLNKGFIVEEPLKRLGVLSFSPDPRQYLAERDVVYAEFDDLDKVRIGQQYTVYEILNTVYHPKEGNEIGQKIRVMGIIEIDTVEEKIARARVITSFMELHRGLLITDLLNHYNVVSPRQNLVKVQATVVDALLEINELGQFHLVMLDRGGQEGVQVGNRFLVMRRGDGYLDLVDEETEKLPWEQIGEALVVEVREHTATAILTHTAMEVRRGDRLEMQLHY
ncbi:LysM peptidoglycan-binding domain-containing protein [Myxococcota bacterium]|nr:LysM peptidoglycan-binding domain-containing protein [Myxococcota bacterium]